MEEKTHSEHTVSTGNARQVRAACLGEGRDLPIAFGASAALSAAAPSAQGDALGHVQERLPARGTAALQGYAAGPICPPGGIPHTASCHTAAGAVRPAAAGWGGGGQERPTPRSPDVQAGQHGRGAPAENPDREEDDEERCAEHHLPGIGGRVADGQGKRHGSSQPCKGKGWQKSNVSLQEQRPYSL